MLITHIEFFILQISQKCQKKIQRASQALTVVGTVKALRKNRPTPFPIPSQDSKESATINPSPEVVKLLYSFLEVAQNQSLELAHH